MDVEDLKKIFEEVTKIKEKMKEIQEGLSKKIVVGDAGAGMVKVSVNGKGFIVNVEIDESLINMNDKEMLQDLIVAATNSGLRKANKMMKEAMGSFAGGLPLIEGLSSIFKDDKDDV